jgi:long-chain acyl-CoA synthetase
VFPDSPAGLAAAISHPAFRIGAADQPPPDCGETPVLETLTSGSSGAPRRIRRTQASWSASFAVNARLGLGPGARVAVLGRLVQSLALYAAVEGLHLGAEVHLLAGLRPDRQARALVRRRITHLYAAPAQLRPLVESQTPCPDLRLMLVGGSKLDSGLRAALSSFAPEAELREFYGAAETSFITLTDPDTPAGSVGRAYPGVDLRVTDGEVWVKSPYVFDGYASDPGSARWQDGWLSVGEVGRLDGPYLTLRGRAGRMVTVADQNVFPEEIEALMAALPGIARVAVLPVPDPKRGQALVALAQGDAGQAAAILTATRRVLGPLKAPKRLIWLEDWPLLPSGKTDLQALRRLPWLG